MTDEQYRLVTDPIEAATAQQLLEAIDASDTLPRTVFDVTEDDPLSYDTITDDDPIEYVWGETVPFAPADDADGIDRAEFAMRRAMEALLDDEPYLAQIYLFSYLVKHDGLEGHA